MQKVCHSEKSKFHTPPPSRVTNGSFRTENDSFSYPFPPPANTFCVAPYLHCEPVLLHVKSTQTCLQGGVFVMNDFDFSIFTLTECFELLFMFFYADFVQNFLLHLIILALHCCLCGVGGNLLFWSEKEIVYFGYRGLVCLRLSELNKEHSVSKDVESNCREAIESKGKQSDARLILKRGKGSGMKDHHSFSFPEAWGVKFS